MESKFSRDRLVGDEVGRIFVANGREYVLQGKLGDGAIGVVRKAVQKDSQKQFAVKFLAPEPKYIEDQSIDDIYRRFKREGERGPGLNHENLVEIIAYEENENGSNFIDGHGSSPVNPFLIMEYVHGRTLEGFIKSDKGIPKKQININKQTLFIAYQLVNALVYLHKRGLVHRDVKPANIFLSRTKPAELPKVIKLGDFGIVKWGDFKASISTGTLTTVGQSGLGTLKYMASEQSLDPRNVGVQSDMYSLGITLFELFTNQILPDVHYVFQLREVRLERSSIENKLYKLGFEIHSSIMNRYAYLFELIFNMFLKAGSRPSSSKAEGILRFALERCDNEYE